MKFLLDKIRLNVRFIVIVTFVSFLAGLTVYTLKPLTMKLPYPAINKLNAQNHYVCEHVGGAFLSGRNSCYDKEIYGKLSKARKLATIDISINGNKLILKGSRILRVGIEGEEWNIVSNNDKQIIATLFNEHDQLATTSASLIIDKQKGITIFSDTYSSLFCDESLVSSSDLFSCNDE